MGWQGAGGGGTSGTRSDVHFERIPGYSVENRLGVVAAGEHARSRE